MNSEQLLHIRNNSFGAAVDAAMEHIKTYVTGNTFDYRQGFEEGVTWVIEVLNRTQNPEASVATGADSSTSAGPQICQIALQAAIRQRDEAMVVDVRLRGEPESLKGKNPAPDQGDAAGLQISSLQAEIEQLLKDSHELVIQLRRQQAYCTRYVRAYQSTARYREVEDLLDRHHHSTEKP